jgi:hypothetical protein
MKPLDRERIVALFEAGADAGPYDELPLIPSRIDPQVSLSRNDRPQPFFLACSADSVIAVVAGTGTVEFRWSSVNTFGLEPGDHVYVPARTPHRISAAVDMVQLRYKARPAGLEAIAWFCDRCGSEVHRVTYDADVTIPQSVWAEATQAFNADPAMRRCSCGTEHPPLDLTGMRFDEVAEAIRAGDADEAGHEVPA